MADRRETFGGSESQEPVLSQQELAPKVGELLNNWRQALTTNEGFKTSLAQAYLSSEAHMQDYTPEQGKRLRVVLDDDTEYRWIRYWTGEERDSLMEVLEVAVIGKEDALSRKGKKILKLIRPWKTYSGDRGQGENCISYEHSLVQGKPQINETNTQAALDYGQDLLKDFQSLLSS